MQRVPECRSAEDQCQDGFGVPLVTADSGLCRVGLRQEEDGQGGGG